MHVASELLTLGDSAHGGNDFIPHHDGAYVLSLAFRDELLNQYVLLLALQQFDDGRGDLLGMGEQDADPLGAFQELDYHGYAAHSLDGGQNVLLLLDERGRGNADVVPRQQLQATQLVPGIQDAVG